MGLYRDDGVVMRVGKLGEADRIITLLTRRHGKVRAVAKGVRRTKSKFGARLEPFSHVDVQFYEGRSLDIVNQAESINAYGGAIVADYPRYTAATALLETAERLSPEEGEPALRLFLLLVGGLRSLAGGEHDPPLILDAFILRAMGVTGWAPSLTDCAVCGTPGPHAAFSVQAGGTVCPACRPPASARPSPATLSLLVALLTSDWASADASEAGARREGSGLVAAHLQWNLERSVRSFPYVERV